MKKILFSIILIYTSTFCKAQNISTERSKYTIGHQDTINIRGVVYDPLGQPAPLILIHSRNKKAIFDGYPIDAVTDSSGRFEFKGILFRDTLVFIDHRLAVINNGSRYLEIHLPQKEEPIFIPPGEITAKRKYKKILVPIFKVQNDSEVGVFDGFTGELYASYKPGHFIDYIRSKITYPEKAIKNNIEGDVEVAFTIDKDGTIKDAQVMRGIGYGCDKAVLNAFTNCPKWRPSLIMGHTVASRSSVTINFKLTDK